MAELIVISGAQTKQNKQGDKQQKQVPKDPAQELKDLVFAHMFLTHKMKYHSLNRYEFEVIKNINLKLEEIGATKVLVLSLIEQANAVYQASKSSHAQQQHEQDYADAIDADTGNIINKNTQSSAHAGVFGLSDEDKKDVIKKQERIFTQSRDDYIAIMSQYTKRTCFRVKVGINLGATELRQSHLNSPNKKLAYIRDKIEEFVRGLLEGGMDTLYTTQNSILSLEKREVTPWDISGYDSTLQGSCVDFFEEEDAKDQEKNNTKNQNTATITENLPDNIKEKLPLDLELITQYIELHPQHIPSTLLFGLLLMSSTIEEYLLDNKEVEKSAPNVWKESRDETRIKNAISKITSLFTGRAVESPYMPNPVKSVGQNITLDKEFIEEYEKEQQKQQSDKKPSLKKEGLLSFLSLDEGSYLLIFSKTT